MSILREAWGTLVKPHSVVLKEGCDNLKRSIFCIEPLESGFGLTLGNALRRVLLSSISGFAVTAFRLEGVMHEYSVLDKIREDIFDIAMNLKSLSIVSDKASPFLIKLFSNKPGPVYSGSIELPSGVIIANKDLVICNLEEGGAIEMQAYVEFGKGYLPSEQQKKLDYPAGTMFIDSLFNPVKSVSYQVETSKVGQMSNYDKLFIDIATDGSLSPREALAIAAKILQEQFGAFVNFDPDKLKNDLSEADENSGGEDFNKNLLKSIDELELSVRSYNCLKNEKIIYVGDLVSKTESDMLKTENFGRKSLNELKENLKSMGLSFGMKLSNWPPENLEALLKQKNKDF